MQNKKQFLELQDLDKKKDLYGSQIILKCFIQFVIVHNNGAIMEL